jgi:16S rRNA G966 N2-methylase RsmD
MRVNLERLGVNAGFRIQMGSVGAFLRKAGSGNGAGSFDVVFLDPPYDAANEYAVALELLGGSACGSLAAGALVIAEHRRKERLEEEYGRLERTRLLEQGDAALSFYEVKSGAGGLGAAGKASGEEAVVDAGETAAGGEGE